MSDYSRRPTGITKCQQCGKPLTARQRAKRALYCSMACYNEAKGRRAGASSEVYVCRYCGRKFQDRKRHGAGLYCSRECAFAARRQESEKRLEERPKPTCVVCGQEFPGRVTARYCSQECRMEAKRRKAREYDKSRRQRTLIVKCRECGVVFVPEYGSKLRAFCSDQCRRNYNRRVGKATRRVRLRTNGPAVPIDPIAVFRRDKWRCQLCGVRTPRRLRGTTHDRAPELDHIVPLALGGTHTWDNVQCVCRKCNREKSAKVLGQLRLAI